MKGCCFCLVSLDCVLTRILTLIYYIDSYNIRKSLLPKTSLKSLSVRNLLDQSAFDRFFSLKVLVLGAFKKEIENELSPKIVNIDVDTLISKL